MRFVACGSVRMWGLAIGLTGLWAGAAPVPVSAKPMPAGVAATVNGVPITTTEVMAAAQQMTGPQALGSLIDNLLIEQKARQERIAATPAEVESRMEELAAEAGGSLDQELTQHHMTRAILAERVRHRILLEKIAGKGLTLEPTIHVRDILIATAPTGRGHDARQPHSDTEALEIVHAAQAKLKAGGRFEDVAKQYSEDPATRALGGDLGILNRSTDPFDGTIWRAAESLKPGDFTSESVKSSVGYHIVQLVSRDNAPLASDRTMYADLRQRIYEAQVSHLTQGTMLRLRADAKVVTYLFK